MRDGRRDGAWAAVGLLALALGLGLAAAAARAEEAAGAEATDAPAETAETAPAETSGVAPEAPPVPEEDPALKIETTREALSEWVKVRGVISKEKRDWKLGREMLQERIALVQSEIDTLREKIAETRKGIDEVEEKKAAREARKATLEDAASTLADVVGDLETRVLAVLERMPPMARSHVERLTQQFPEAGQETKLSLSQRFAHVLGVLNELNKLHRTITVMPDTRELPGGGKAEVTVVYVGLSKAYYASANGKVAGLGTTSADGWTWVPANDAAGAILRAIKILNSEDVAAYVRLPVTIQ